jgi:hypothetical protein
MSEWSRRRTGTWKKRSRRVYSARTYEPLSAASASGRPYFGAAMIFFAFANRAMIRKPLA